MNIIAKNTNDMIQGRCISCDTILGYFIISNDDDTHTETCACESNYRTLA